MFVHSRGRMSWQHLFGLLRFFRFRTQNAGETDEKVVYLQLKWQLWHCRIRRASQGLRLWKKSTLLLDPAEDKAGSCSCARRHISEAFHLPRDLFNVFVVIAMNWGQPVLCPGGNGRLNEFGEFRVGSEGYLDYLFCKCIQHNSLISLKSFSFLPVASANLFC